MESKNANGDCIAGAMLLMHFWISLALLSFSELLVWTRTFFWPTVASNSALVVCVYLFLFSVPA